MAAPGRRRCRLKRGARAGIQAASKLRELREAFTTPEEA